MNAPISRLPFCGGTDAAAIVCSHVGAAYFRPAWEVWAERHAPEAVPPRAPMEQGWLDLGNALEGYVLASYGTRIAPDGLRVGLPMPVYGPVGREWMRGQLDAPVLDAAGVPVGLVDAKTSRLRSHWFSDEDGQRVETEPLGYRVQVGWYLGLLRLAYPSARFADLAALDLMSARLDVRTIEYDASEWGGILAIVIPWWERHIVGGERPADDTSEACERWHLFCQPRQKSARVATAEEAAAVLRWQDARRSSAAAAKIEAAAKLAVLDAMDTERLTMGPEKSAPYVQVQAAGKGGRTVRAYRFPSEAGEAGEE